MALQHLHQHCIALHALALHGVAWCGMAQYSKGYQLRSSRRYWSDHQVNQAETGRDSLWYCIGSTLQVVLWRMQIRVGTTADILT